MKKIKIFLIIFFTQFCLSQTTNSVENYIYKKKSLNSKTYKSLNKEKLKFIKFNKVNISSSQLRKI